MPPILILQASCYKVVWDRERQMVRGFVEEKVAETVGEGGDQVVEVL